MKEASIIEFTASCREFLDDLRQTKQSLRITEDDESVAEIIPSSTEKSNDWIDSMKDEIEIVGDIVSGTEQW